MKLALVTATVLLASVVSASVEHYYGNSVYRLRPSSVEQVQLLQKLEEEGVDFWREADQVNRIADVRLTPENKRKVLKYFNDNAIPYELMVPDVEK